MSRRVLVKGDIGQAVGTVGGAASGAARGAALGSIVPGVGTVLGGIAGAFLGAKTGGKVGDALTGGENITEANNQQSFTDKVKSRGEKAAEAGAAYAQAQQASQQRMEERGQQMAEKAKAGSQIATGEAMDMSWQMLKAWSFVPGFDAFDKELVINHAKKRKLKHVSNHDLGHHDMRFNQRYKPNQEMPKGAEKLTPRDLALAYMDLMLRRNPELLNQANTKMPARDKSKPDNFPGLTFPLLQTDEPIRSTYEGDNGKMMQSYHPVFATGHDHHEPSEHPKAALITAYDSPTGSTDRAHMPVTHVPNMYSHDFYDIGDDAARQAYYDKADAPVGVSQVARNRRIIADEIDRRHFGDFLQPIDFERMKQQGLGRSMSQSQAEARVYGQNPMADETMNPLKIYPDGSPLARQYRQFLASNPPGDDDDDDDGGSGGGRKLQPIATAPPIHLGGGMYMWQGKYYGGLGQPPLPPEAAAMIQTGEPMDLAWRMLKGELQLPHQITEALRSDLTTLDRAHKMTDTNEGTLIENIHPDMEQVVKLLAEKHLGDMNPTMSRPPMPLFHGQFL